MFFVRLLVNIVQKSAIRKLALALLVASMAGCVGQFELEGFAQKYKLHREWVHAGQFDLLTLASKTSETPAALHIYLGGDGRPWDNNKPAVNPTGNKSLAIALMAEDPTPALYIARPCYYLDQMPENCKPSLWTSGRYSEPVIASMADAVEKSVSGSGANKVTLIGYSGGGVLALLIAQRLSTRPTVVTIATNLDIDNWTKFHKLLPLNESINPVDAISTGSGFRQIHLIGKKDQVVPVPVISRYVEKHVQASYYYYDAFDHSCCWVKNWQDILLTLHL